MNWKESFYDRINTYTYITNKVVIKSILNINKNNILQIKLLQNVKYQLKTYEFISNKVVKRQLLFMTNEEIWNIGLEERTDELSKLQSEYDRLDVECRKAEFEMDMYARLREVNNAMLYKQKFSEKYEKCARASEKLTKQKNALENEISVLKKEIYYINSLM